MAEYTVDGLAELASPAANDEIGIWDVSAGQYLKIRRDTLVGGTVTGGGTIATGGYTLTVPATGTAALITTGTWTPQLYFGGGATGLTYSNRSGNYVRVGNLVFLVGFFQLSAKGSSTGNAAISGLPVAPASEIAMLSCFFSGMATNWAQVTPYTSAGLLLVAGTQAAAAAMINLTQADFGNSTTLFFSGCYRV